MLTFHQLLPVLCIVLLPLVALAEEFRGKVVRVVEGDTVTVLRDRIPVKLRLQAVDCPEKAQPFGDRAIELTSSLVLDKVVTVRGARLGKGRWTGRVTFEKLEVIEVMRGDRREERRSKVQAALEEELVQAGLAWVIPGESGEGILPQLEKQARSLKRGLWAEANPVPPWEWRPAGHKKK